MTPEEETIVEIEQAINRLSESKQLAVRQLVNVFIKLIEVDTEVGLLALSLLGAKLSAGVK